MKLWNTLLSILVFILMGVVIYMIWFSSKERAYFEYNIRENNRLIFGIGETISPHGFGFYPAIPDPLPKRWEREDIFVAEDVFPQATAEQELWLRVEIELMSQGKEVLGIQNSSGYLLPIYPDVVYVRHNKDGSVNTGGPDALRDLIDEIAKKKGVLFPSPADIPSHIKVVNFEDGAIDPYKFLDLPNYNKELTR